MDERLHVRLLLRRQAFFRQVGGHGVQERPRGPAELALVGGTFGGSADMRKVSKLGRFEDDKNIFRYKKRPSFCSV
jgi:hypothetical protein